jgi:predicted  nucleic acid-binding Zn-ribbon protein
LDEQLRWLVELQRSDTRLMELRRLRTELPLELERIAEEIQRQRAQLNETREQLEGLKLLRRKREKDLEVELEKVKRSQARLYEAKTNKEYQALLKEIESVKETIGQLEEEILLLMEKIDETVAKLNASEQAFREEERGLSAQRDSIAAEIGGLESQEMQLQEQREKVASQVDPNWMAVYVKVAKRYGGLAVVRVDGGTCQGCFLSIPPQLYNEILKNGPVVQCPFCGRFIYHEPVGSS